MKGTGLAPLFKNRHRACSLIRCRLPQPCLYFQGVCSTATYPCGRCADCRRNRHAEAGPIKRYGTMLSLKFRSLRSCRCSNSRPDTRDRAAMFSASVHSRPFFRSSTAVFCRHRPLSIIKQTKVNQMVYGFNDKSLSSRPAIESEARYRTNRAPDAARFGKGVSDRSGASCARCTP